MRSVDGKAVLIDQLTFCFNISDYKSLRLHGESNDKSIPVTGSSRMKSGTGQKMILNMISTATMIRLGRVKGNRMVNMQLSNRKLVDRGTRMLVDELGLPYEEAQALLLRHGSVRKALDAARTDRPLTSSPETRNHNY